ncbi:dihydrolipoamide acetyltransferase family protein [Leifsonia poae]|uniref:Dihydrolipoamide acetyltransferase component of pyruvate dehydrogenase complex n=1 Tax=Leifsonia poae TaxID=110933 RepID=A0A9W6HD15_9MICO|nr:dihydrolipoamide acetyltransferase family protein [Leifsonia poae]GLJ77528.1 dihydrolipoamide acetyltransferase component of pyruvate dehydrogenase complex [Leifsonia poae]
MGAIKEFALPDLGEGLTESELVSWHVAVGDTVELNQIIAEVETAKALVELPAPYSGIVSRLFVEPGVTVSVGDPIVAFEIPDASAPADGASPSAESAAPEPNLVGYGAKADSTSHPRRRERPGLATSAVPVSSVSSFSSGSAGPSAPASTGATATTVLERPRATPPVRKLARERGIDLAAIAGTGDRGLITRHDVENFAEASPVAPPVEQARDSVVETRTSESGERRPRETRIPIKGVRKWTADAMVRSAFTAPHATVFLTVDVTPTMELLERLRAQREFAESRPGLLAVTAKALCLAVRRTPSVNARWEDDTQEIVEFGYVDLGIAAATPRGLVVPTIPDADTLDLAGLATGIRELAETARAGRTSPERLSGGTISITNVGVFGVDAGTPILTPGESAILALGAVRRQPWEYRGEIALRQVVTLAVSFDHRVVDGEQGARFIADIGRVLADPASVLAMV